MESVRGKMTAMKPVCIILISEKMRTPLLRINKTWKRAAKTQAIVMIFFSPTLEAIRLRK